MDSMLLEKNLVPVIFLQSSQVPASQVSPFLVSLDKSMLVLESSIEFMLLGL
jgi:hypothetical protein